jgi:hypothetical protein
MKGEHRQTNVCDEGRKANIRETRGELGKRGEGKRGTQEQVKQGREKEQESGKWDVAVVAREAAPGEERGARGREEDFIPEAFALAAGIAWLPC